MEGGCKCEKQEGCIDPFEYHTYEDCQEQNLKLNSQSNRDDYVIIPYKLCAYSFIRTLIRIICMILAHVMTSSVPQSNMSKTARKILK